MGGNVHDRGLLDPSGPAPNDGHLLAHDDITRQFVVSGKGERIDVNLELVQLTHLVAVAWPHSLRKIGGYHPCSS